MPYSYHKEGDKYVVTKKDTGKEVGRTKGTKKALDAYLTALHSNVKNENKTNKMKKSELTKMIGEIIKEVISEQSSKLKLRTLTEGQFSWMTQDTGEQIGSQVQNKLPEVYMFDNMGNNYKESNYEGYGEFGGMDYYELLDKMNGGSGDRSRGIRLAFNKIKIDSEVLFPALVTNPNFNWKSHDFTQQPENDPNQSWYMEPEEDDDVSSDWDEDEDEDEIYESKKQFKSLKNNKKTSKMNEAEKPSMFVTGGSINPELRKKVEQFVKGVAKYYDYSVDDAFLAIMTVLKGGLNKMNEAVIDTEKAFRLVAKGDRDAALETLKTEVNKIINSNKEYSDTKVSYILSKGNPKDIIIKLNGLGARVISGMISMKTPAIKNNFDKVSTYKPQLTKIS
jgi:hypothetical protein